VTNQPKAPGTPKPALIQEITPPKGILKNTANRAEKVPVWKWSQAGSQIVLTICVPELVDRSQIQTSTLDIEERRLILTIKSLYALDINLDVPEHLSNSCVIDSETREQFTTLERARAFDVNNAAAEWRVAKGVILIHV